jgi:cell division septal protein FtsQ
MNKYFIIFLFLFIITSCSSFSSSGQFKLEDFKMTSKYPLISDEQFLDKKILSFINLKDSTQENFTNLFSTSWVNNLSSRNRWMQNLEVKIKEYQPTAYWNKDSYLTQSGIIISPDRTSLELDLVQLFGEESKRFKLIDFSRRLQLVLMKINKSVETLSLENGYLKALTSDSTLIFFDFYEFRGQLRRLEQLIQFELSSGNKKNLKRLDFRYKNGVAVLFS